MKRTTVTFDTDTELKSTIEELIMILNMRTGKNYKMLSVSMGEPK